MANGHSSRIIALRSAITTLYNDGQAGMDAGYDGALDRLDDDLPGIMQRINYHLQRLALPVVDGHVTAAERSAKAATFPVPLPPQFLDFWAAASILKDRIEAATAVLP